jgi:hypothetical protein
MDILCRLSKSVFLVLELDQPKETEQNKEKMWKCLLVSQKKMIVPVVHKVVFDVLCKLIISLLFNVHQSFFERFLPPPTAPVRWRRVIESIILHVCRKYGYSNKVFIWIYLFFIVKRHLKKLAIYWKDENHQQCTN